MKNFKDIIFKILKKNYLFIIIYVIAIIALICPLPYYINARGGIINVFDKIDYKDKTNIKGSLNMTYVSEMKATIPTIILAKLNSDYDIFKKDEVKASNETIKESELRSKLMLQEANDNALIYAYKISNKQIEIVSNKVYVTYIDTEANTNLKIGDQIISVEDINIYNKEDIAKIVKNKKNNDIISLQVLRDKETLNVTAKVYEYNNTIVMGVILTEEKEIRTNPELKIKFNASETGPSGGLMMTLGIYSILNSTDLTKGKIISGTGTIDIDGTVGEISGIKYKLAGAVKNKASVFLCPDGDNYNEAIRLKKEKKYDIEIVSIKNFKEALNYLKNN